MKFKYALADGVNIIQTDVAESVDEFAERYNLEFVYTFANCAVVNIKGKKDWVYGMTRIPVQEETEVLTAGH